MTILSCQKRHHEPHWVHDYLRPGMTAEWCDGLPQWPYARPKPPRISDPYHHGAYCREYGVIAALKGETTWMVWAANDMFAPFPTHAEAIMCAQNLVNERRKTSGTYQDD